MENKKYPIVWEFKNHSYSIGDTGDYDGYWEITNGKDSLITKEDYDDIEKDLQAIVDLLNSTYPNFTVDRGNEAALDAENKWLRQELEELRNAPTGPRWVKAVDRLPDGAGRITWRWIDQEAAYIGFDGTAFVYDKGGARVDMLYAIEIEWLDESPEQQSDVVEFVNWLHLHATKVSWDTGKLTNHWVYRDKAYTTAELYDIFKKEGK